MHQAGRCQALHGQGQHHQPDQQQTPGRFHGRDYIGTAKPPPPRPLG
jgi:hypothetical protein